jgi:hypothetical protein
MSGFFPTGGGGGGGGGLGLPLVSAVLGAPAPSISVAGIPTSSGGQSLRNLLCIYGKAEGSNAAVSVGLTLTVNGDSTIGHYGQSPGPGGFAGGFGNPGFSLIIPAANTAEPGGGYFWIHNYTDASFFPTFTGVCGGRIGLAGTAADFMNPNVWNGVPQFTGPVSSMALTALSGNLLAGMYFEVFGVA